MPTGAKLFLILSAALLPLALIAVAATLQTTRTADLQNRAELRVATGGAARSLAIELVGDTNALRSAVAAIEADPGDTAVCARTRGVFAPSTLAGARYAVVDRTGRLRCGTPPPSGAPTPGPNAVATRLVPGQGLLIGVTGNSGTARASAFFPTSYLADIARPSDLAPKYGSELTHDDSTLSLRALPGRILARREHDSAPVGLDRLMLNMVVDSAPITSAVVAAMLLPILMWAAAAGISWFVIDRLLIRSLRRLRAAVGAYQPGETFDPVRTGHIAAQEIRELGETFAGLSRTIADHEADLAEGLVRQTKLTREVHHRVKNNLQVITSLINFHSRSATGAEAIAAYAAIQRRVDALAVVHRHHFAELEENRGLGLRSVLSELAANIRATATGPTRDFGLTLEIDPFLVSQDTAVAIAFLITELVELAMSVDPTAQLRISVKPGDQDTRAVVRVASPALIETEKLRKLITERYGRVSEGLARQLRAPLHHQPLAGVFEIAIAVTGRD
ncbi:sensor histidine kinase [Sphingomonas sp.]|uniref:sensor histidine kinase n=1 Tax=Sphingomonas sp. TaxID=28214 RepID=UPI002B8D0A82|nr:sensor histidine kinase [Sphingomonas sp.]HWK35338.1 sensor histidine kinase [Sphingomonas sp.]